MRGLIFIYQSFILASIKWKSGLICGQEKHVMNREKGITR